MKFCRATPCGCRKEVTPSTHHYILVFRTHCSNQIQCWGTGGLRLSLSHCHISTTFRALIITEKTNYHTPPPSPPQTSSIQNRIWISIFLRVDPQIIRGEITRWEISIFVSRRDRWDLNQHGYPTHRQLNPIPVFQPLFKDPLQAKIWLNPQMPVLYSVLSTKHEIRLSCPQLWRSSIYLCGQTYN